MKYEDLIKLSHDYDVPLVDVIFISINRYGVEMDTTEKRIRLKIKLDIAKEEYYLAIPVNTYPSPFKIIDNKMYIGSVKLGNITKLEKDTCDTTYFRKNKKEMTFNSNARSMCSGCKFCGTYNLDANDQYHLTDKEIIDNYITNLLKSNNMKDLRNVEGITVCTGCFTNEDKLIEHLKLLRMELKKFGFDKRLKYIGSQIRSDKALLEIKKELLPFSLFITTETFTNRNKIMRSEKASLDIEKTCDLLNRANKLGIETTILYIAGLESLEDFNSNMKKISKCVNKFPIVQIFQNYEESHENYRVSEAKDISFYLKVRASLEDIFRTTNYKPNSWENYRSLFYTTYDKKEYDSIRI